MIRDSSSVRLTWSLSRGPGSGWLGLFAPGLLTGFLLFGFAFGEFFLVLSPFFVMTRGGPTFDFLFGAGNGVETFFAATELLGNIQTVWSFASVRLFGQPQQFFDLGFELDFELVGILPTQSMAFGCIGLDLGSVQADFAQLQATHLMSNEQNLDKKRIEQRQKPLAEVGNGIVIGMVVGGNVTKCERIIGRLFQFTTGKDACRITVKQQSQQHFWMMRLGAAPGVGRFNLTEVELFYDVYDKPGQMLLGQPVVQ